MCGICGTVSRVLTQGEIKAFETLMTLSTLRGVNGAGVIGREPSLKAKPFAFKTVHSWPQLIQSDQYTRIKTPPAFLIGHCRWPTVGGYEIQDVHPHRSGHILGVHNGTMDIVDGKKVAGESDSLLLISSIATKGIKETIKNSKGAYVIVWYDTQEKTINFIRNKERPLSFCYTDNGSTLFWASEQDMLTFALRREKQHKDATYYTLPENQHWKIATDGSMKLTFGGTITSEVEEPPKGNSSAPDGGSTEQDTKTVTTYSYTENGITRTSVPLVPKTSSGATKTCPVPVSCEFDEDKALYLTSDGAGLNIGRLFHAFEEGCAMCKTTKEANDWIQGRIKVGWVSPRVWMCEECCMSGIYEKVTQ